MTLHEENNSDMLFLTKGPTGRTLKPAGAASLPGPSSVDPSTTLAGDNEQHIQVIVQDDTGNEEQDPDECKIILYLVPSICF